MGIPNLWQELSPAATTTTLPSYCLSSFASNSNSSRGLRLGIDASLWLFHAQQSSGGSNPYLRLLFYRLAKLLTLPVLPLFVFDGAERPTWKRGKQVKGKRHAIEEPFTLLIEAFGFQWWRARGEAEAELAWLNREGVVDAVLTDDSDALLFGAKVVVRNWGRNLSGTKAFSRTTSTSSDVFEESSTQGAGGLQLTGSDRDHLITLYKASVLLSHPDLGLDTDGLILIALMSGGDYDTTGLLQCGVKIALALARGGFGTSLISAFKSSYPTLSSASQPCASFSTFLSTWLEDVREELCSNSHGFLPTRRPKLASTIKDSFLATAEFRRVLAFYVYPLTSAGKHAEVKGKSGEPDLERLASLVQRYFQWSKEAILGKFRRVLGPGVVVRSLRQEIVEMVDGAGREGPWESLVDSPGSKAVRRYRLGLDGERSDEEIVTKASKGKSGRQGEGKQAKKPMHDSPNATRITDFFSRTALDGPPSPPTPPSRSSPRPAAAPTLNIQAIKLQRRHASLVPFLDYRVLASMEEFTQTAERGIDIHFDAELRASRTQDVESDTELDDTEDHTGSRGKGIGGRVDDSREPLLIWIPEPLLQLSISGGEKLDALVKELEKKAAAKSAKKAGSVGGGKKNQMSLMDFVKSGSKASLNSTKVRMGGRAKDSSTTEAVSEPMTPRTARQLRIPSGLMRRTESVPLPPPPPPPPPAPGSSLGVRRGLQKVRSLPNAEEAEERLGEEEGDSSIEFLGAFVSSNRNTTQVHSRPCTPPPTDSSTEPVASRSNKSPKKSHKIPPRTREDTQHARATPSQRALAEPHIDHNFPAALLEEDGEEIIPPSPTRLFGAILAKGIQQQNDVQRSKPRISAITISDDSDTDD